MGRPGDNREPAPGRHYPRSTPNSWAPMSADEVLGLVYVPTGGSTPDHWGGARSPAAERYGSSVVALDATTGAPRWRSEEHTSELQSLMRISYAVFCLKKKKRNRTTALIHSNI